MAKSSNNMVMLFNLVLVFSPFLIVSMAEGRLGFGSEEQDSTPTCQKIFGVRAGDTCSSVAEKFNLSLSFFSTINPNFNCDKLFVGQWLCVGKFMSE